MNVDKQIKQKVLLDTVISVLPTSCPRQHHTIIRGPLHCEASLATPVHRALVGVNLTVAAAIAVSKVRFTPALTSSPSTMDVATNGDTVEGPSTTLSLMLDTMIGVPIAMPSVAQLPQSSWQGLID